MNRLKPLPDEPKRPIPKTSPDTEEINAGSQAYSPYWGSTVKLVIGLAFAAIIIFLVFRFLNIVGPLLMAFILAYILYPLASFLHKVVRIPWRIGVTIIYLLLLAILLGSLTASGLAIVEQMQSLIKFLESVITDLPGTIQKFLSTSIAFGPFVFRPETLNLDLNTVAQQVAGVVQPLLSGAGTLVGSFATSAATVIGWVFFILIISYFILAESGGFPNLLTNLKLPGYAHDLQRLSDELSHIWNAFLRGQLTIVLITIVIYNFLLGAEGVKFFYLLALLAGMARFIPFVGPLVAWTTYGLVTYFQGSTIFGLPPIGYAALVVGTAWLTDLLLDNLVSPRIMAEALKVHPAAVMISALIGANLLGFVGVVLAAPVLATVQLFFDYIIHKLLDQDPWADMKINPPAKPLPTLVPEMQRGMREFRVKMSKKRFPWLEPPVDKGK